MSISLEEELSALIDAERERPEQDIDAADRVWQGVQSRLGGAPAPASVPALSGAPKWGGLSIVAGGLAVLAIVGVSAVGLSSIEPSDAIEFQPLPPEPALSVATATPEIPHLRAEVPAKIALSEQAEAPLQSRPRKSLLPKRGGSVADELILIERARKSLESGKAKSALKTLSEHRRAFPKGSFVEEATALKASALCKAGRTDDANKLATKFDARWPRSVHAARVHECTE